jgi:hypothetical protein
MGYSRAGVTGRGYGRLFTGDFLQVRAERVMDDPGKISPFKQAQINPLIRIGFSDVKNGEMKVIFPETDTLF